MQFNPPPVNLSNLFILRYIQLWNKADITRFAQKLLKYGIWFFLLFFTSIIIAQTTIVSAVSSGYDDAEERTYNGFMSLFSSDLELTEDSGRNQWVGIRFQDISIPQGTTILSASIQFTVDETDYGNTSVQIWGQDTDNAPAFTFYNSNISSRTRTAASVNWTNIPVWNTVGQAGADQRTPDLTTIVQEIVNRAGWSSGNSMAFLINGTGERTAESYNGNSNAAPVLTIVADFNLDPLPNIIANPNRGLPFIYFMADDRSELYSVAPDPSAIPLPSPNIVNTSFGGSPITFSGEGGGYRSTDRMVYVFDGGGSPANSSDMYAIDPDTGVATLVKADIVSGHVEGAEFWINNNTGEEVLFILYQNGTSGGPNRIMAVNPNPHNGLPAWTPYAGYPVVLSGAITRADGISWNPDTAEFYIQNDDNVDYYTVDITTGATTFAYSTNLAVDGEGITYAADGTNYIEDEGQAGRGRTIFQVNTTTGVLTPAAQLGSTGDVESIMGNLGVRNDAGDAPSSYGYAAHILPVLTATSLSVYLGNNAPDSEDPFANFSIGNSDDNSGDDEDGVLSNGSVLDGQLFQINTTKTLDITTNGAGFLNAWIDFNRDGDFNDAGEQIASDVSPSGGSITLNVTIPAAATLGVSYARFRFSSETGLSSGNSEAADGEVEDYQIIIDDPITCPPGTALVTDISQRHVYATAVIVDNSVANENNALGNNDATTARFNNINDELILEMGELINSGDPITVNGEDGDDFNIWISTSSTGPWTQVGNAAVLDFTFTSPINWQYIRFMPSDGAGVDNLSYVDATLTDVISSCKIDTDGDNVADIEDTDDDNDGIPDVDESNGNNPDGDEDGDGISNYLDTTDNGNSGDGSVTNYTDANLDGIPDVYDTEGDAVPNHLDLDSDNDGILDAVEAGHGQSHVNGVISGPYGLNGLANTVETIPESGVINYVIAESSDDADTISNFLDLDSDGDGIPDNTEAQTTTGYTAPSGTVDANGVFTNYTAGLTPINIDGTDNPDYLDTDSDNEGGNDTTEAGIALAGVDTDGDGLDDGTDAAVGYSDPGGTIDNPLSGSVILTDSDNDANSGGDVDFRDALDDRPDNDNDGVADVDDIDDDNDGILDIDEGCGNLVINGNFEAQDFSSVTEFPGGATEPAGTFIGQNYNSNTVYGWDQTWNMDGWVGNQSISWSPHTFAPALSRNQYLDVIGNNTQSGGLNNVLSQTINTEIGQSYTFSFYWGEDVGHNTGSTAEMDVYVIDASNVNLLSQNLTTIAQGEIGGIIGPKRWFKFEQVFTATTTTTTIMFAATPDGTSNGMALDYVSVFKNGACQDTDNDGVIDAFDLDSDNDGILDAVEAGHNQPHTNGVINGPVGDDGLPDAVQDSPNNEQINYTIAESTDDTDDIPNFLDLDADGDGIPDNIEAQTTTGYTAPSGTVDTNGVFTNYTTGLTPTNTDGTDNPDYLDTDSDNEGGNDTAEAGITLSNNDADGDGLDNNTDATGDYSDPGGIIDDPLSGAVILPDLDTDALTGGNVDFRDATDDRLDTDGDGIFDTVDIDDDNDGIPDEDENADCYGSHASGNVFNENFGAGNRTSTPYTNYIYEPNDYPNGGGSINDGEYAIINDIPSSASWAPAFWVDSPDHTGDPNGRMALFNSTNSALEEFYNRNNIAVTPNANQEFSFWVLNVDLVSTPNNRALPNITVYIRDNVGATTLATFNTGDVPKDEQWHNYKFTFNPGANNQIRMVLINNAIGGAGNDLALDDIQINILCDTDDDGIINSLDLDSDNDGILDVVEAGHNSPHTNGVLNGNPADFGNNGLLNTLEDNDTSDANTNYTISESLDDTDAIPDFLDLDADGDGIPDNVEAQITTGYTAPSGTIDANGVFTNYTAGLTPTNTDGTDNPDYLDTDSDNEAGNDTTEAGITLSNNDTDNDGLDDATDAATGYTDSGGTIDNPLTTPIILPDYDNDATTGGDVDFRDALTISDLKLTKTVNNSNPDEGDSITFTITIANDGPSAATTIEMQDVIPAGFTYISSNASQGTINYNSGTNILTWNLGSYNLPTGNTISLQYTVRVDVCGQFVNRAEITNSSLTDPDSTPGNGN